MGRGNISIVSNNKSHRYTKKSQIILEGQGLQGAIDDGLFFFILIMLGMQRGLGNLV